jgi:hypothetical protein
MILARVLLGRQVVGVPGMRRPPAGCESVHGNGMWATSCTNNHIGGQEGASAMLQSHPIALELQLAARPSYH